MSRSISQLFDDGRALSPARDEAVFHTGDPVAFMYLVVAGQIDLIRHSQSGARMILHRATAGQVLAEASAYSDLYHCDGRAAHASTLHALPITTFRTRLEQDAGLAHVWAVGLAHALQSARLSGEIRGLRTVSERLDAWLSDKPGLPEKGRWSDLAQVLGVSREALYREIAKRRSAGNT